MANAFESDLPKMMHIAVHGEEDAMYRLLGADGGEAVENYSPRRTYTLIKKLWLDKGIEYSSPKDFLVSLSKNFGRNGVPLHPSFSKDRIVFRIECPLAAAVHPSVPIRKCILAKYVAALAFRLSKENGRGFPVLLDSRFTSKGSLNTIAFVKTKKAKK